MKKTISWFISIVVTLSVVLFQFAMGISDPMEVRVNTGRQHIQLNLIRTYIGRSDCPIILQIGDIMVTGYMLYRTYPSNNEMTKIVFDRQGDRLIAKLPNQPPDGRLEYKVVLERENNTIYVNEGKPVIIRFLGKVPFSLVIVQSLLILCILILSTYSGILAGLGIKTYRGMIYLIAFLLIGVVFVVQPIMHNYSLNKWWTCMPNSWELGDNKLFIAMVLWLITIFYNFKKSRPVLVIISSIFTVLLFSIPHGFPGVPREAVTIEIFTRKLIPLIQLF